MHLILSVSITLKPSGSMRNGVVSLPVIMTYCVTYDTIFEAITVITHDYKSPAFKLPTKAQ